MKILWSLPVRGELLGSSRGDLVRANNLIEALRQNGHEVNVVEFGTPTAVSAYRQIVRGLLPRLPAMAIRDAGRWAASFGHARHVAAQAAKCGADAIVETQVGFSFSGAKAARQTNLPLILDDCSPSREEKDLGACLPWLALHAMRLQSSAAALVFASSQAIAESLAKEGVPSGKIRVLPNGVNSKSYTSPNRDAVRMKIGMAHRCVIGFAGSFQPWHATGLLVEALEALRGNSLWHLMLVGDGPTLAPTLRVARDLGLGNRVTATGAVPPEFASELVSSFDIGALPGSNDYGHPMKLMEYAAAGLAIVAPNLRPVRDVVQDMETALLFSPGNQSELASKLRLLVCDAGLRRKMGDQARLSVTVRDEWRTRAHELAAAIRQLLPDRMRLQPVDLSTAPLQTPVASIQLNNSAREGR